MDTKYVEATFSNFTIISGEGIEKVDRDIIAKHLYTGDQEPVDFLIRTSGEQRLSNFMLWQAAYSEFWYSDVNWPDFSPKDIDRMIADYQKRDRRFGGRK